MKELLVDYKKKYRVKQNKTLRIKRPNYSLRVYK